MSSTEKYTGRNQLHARLTEQVGGDAELARKILIKRGHMSPSGQLTAEGRRRNIMTADERAADRKAKAKNPPDLTYHAKRRYV